MRRCADQMTNFWRSQNEEIGKIFQHSNVCWLKLSVNVSEQTTPGSGLAAVAGTFSAASAVS